MKFTVTMVDREIKQTKWRAGTQARFKVTPSATGFLFQYVQITQKIGSGKAHRYDKYYEMWTVTKGKIEPVAMDTFFMSKRGIDVSGYRKTTAKAWFVEHANPKSRKHDTGLYAKGNKDHVQSSCDLWSSWDPPAVGFRIVNRNSNLLNRVVKYSWPKPGPDKMLDLKIDRYTPATRWKMAAKKRPGKKPKVKRKKMSAK